MAFPRFLLFFALGPLLCLYPSGCDGGCNQGALSGSAGFSGLGRGGSSALGSGGVGGGAGQGSGGRGSGGSIPTGIAGSSGFTGGGSTGQNCNFTPSPTCPRATCGNNVRTTCSVPGGSGVCPSSVVTEPCDGTDFGGLSCQSFGFGSGRLTCIDCASIEIGNCDECQSSDASVLRCGAEPIGAMRPQVAAIAGSATEVGLAWTSRVDDTSTLINFARLTPNLDLISSSQVLATFPDAVRNLEVRPLPSGWLVAGYVEPNVLIMSLDATGKVRQRRSVEVVPVDRLWTPPVLASHPDGRSLIAWQSDLGVRAAMIGADGVSLTLLPDIAAGSQAALRAAVFANDAFYVALTLDTPTNSAQLSLARISAAGVLEATIEVLPGVDGWSASFVPGAADLRLIYTGLSPRQPPGEDFVSAAMWQRLNTAGEPATPPTLLGREPQFSGFAQGVGFGDDTVVLLNNLADPPSLGISRVASNGSFSYPSFKLTSSPISPIWSAFTRRGPDAVAVWLTEKGIRLARIMIEGTLP